MVFNLGTEGIVIIVAIVLLFGAAAIPRLARSLGRARGEFTKAKREFDRELAAGEQAVGEQAGASEAEVRRTARELGIDEEGRSLDEVKELLNQKLA